MSDTEKVQAREIKRKHSFDLDNMNVEELTALRDAAEGKRRELLTKAQQDVPFPEVFIGSSSSALGLARRIKWALGDRIRARVWNQSVFEMGYDLLSSLLTYVNCFDFSIFVLSPDDLVSSKGSIDDSPRDNVILELGMFMGVRGRRHAFPIIVRRPGRNLKLPSDLEGNIATILDPERLDDESYFAKQIGNIRKVIEERARQTALSLLPSAGLALGYFHNFLVPVATHLSEMDTISLSRQKVDISEGNYSLAIAVPRSLSDAGIIHRDYYVRKLGLLPFRVPQRSPKKKGRTYELFVFPEPKNGKVQFLDYPTMIRVSHDVIFLYLQQMGVRTGLGERPSLGVGDERIGLQELMEGQEIRNFKKALKFLLLQRDAQRYRERVEFIDIPL